MKARHILGAAGLPALLLAGLVATPATAHDPGHDVRVRVVASGLDNPRGIDIGRFGGIYVAEAGAGRIDVLARGGVRPVIDGLPHLTSPEGETTGPVNVAVSRWGRVYGVVGGGPRDVDARFGTVQKRGGLFADITAYVANNPDPYDTENEPTDSNPYGIADLRDGRLLVTDAANNSLLLVGRDGSIRTVARIPTHLVSTAHVGDPTLPPQIPAEAVPTTVAVGPDGSWYVGELTGFPFTPGASRIWKIAPSARNAVCDDDTSDGCRLFATGFTSVTGMDFGPDGSLYVVEIVKNGVLGLFTGQDTTGALIRYRHGKQTEIAAGRLTAPQDVAVSRRGTIYVTNKSVMPDGEVLKITR